MPTQHDIAAQHDLLATHRRTLAIYLRQRALQSAAFMPPAVEHGIHEARSQIHQIKQTLRSWHVEVADHPDDQEHQDSAAPNAKGSRVARILAAIGMGVALLGVGAFLYFVVSFLMVIFSTLFANSATPPDFGSLGAQVRLELLPIGVGAVFIGIVLTAIAGMAGRPRSQS